MSASAGVTLSARDLSHVLMLAIGALKPLSGFLTRRDYRGVVKDRRLDSGAPWTIPITLSASRAQAAGLKVGRRVPLSARGLGVVAELELEEKFGWDKEADARRVFGTGSVSHPGVAVFLAQGEVFLGGRVLLAPTFRPSYGELDCYWLPPAESRRLFKEKGWKTVAGFQTRNAPHRGHEFLMRYALEKADGLFLHPTAGETKDDDLPAAQRFPCYRALVRKHLPKQRVVLALNPSPMYYAGPREAVHHAIIRRNYGCTHFVVGRDHAGVNGQYGAYAAQDAFAEFRKAELGIEPIFSEKILYCRDCADVLPASRCAHGQERHLEISGTRVRRALEQGARRPAHIVRQEVWTALLSSSRGGGDR